MKQNAALFISISLSNEQSSLSQSIVVLVCHTRKVSF